MARKSSSRRIALLFGIAAAVVTAGAAAQQQVFRYVDKDGKVVYSDRSPPTDSKEVQAKRLSPNFIENNRFRSPRQAANVSGHPYTFACGACPSPPRVCQSPWHPSARQRRGRQRRGAVKKLAGERRRRAARVKLVAKGFNGRAGPPCAENRLSKSAPRRDTARGWPAPPRRRDAPKAVPSPAAGIEAAVRARARAPPFTEFPHPRRDRGEDARRCATSERSESVQANGSVRSAT
jgi:hypothetical protein